MNPKKSFDDATPEEIEAFAYTSETAYAGLPHHERVRADPNYVPATVNAARGIPTFDSRRMVVGGTPEKRSRWPAIWREIKRTVAAFLGLYALVAVIVLGLHRLGTDEARRDHCSWRGESRPAGLWPARFAERMYFCGGVPRWE